MAKVTFGLSVESYDVEHLATFSIALPSQQLTTSKFAIQQLLTMEKESGIWVQRMIIKIDGSYMLIIDAESNDVVEKFSANLIYSPISFNHHDHLFNNILIFMVQHPNETQGELHLFNCLSHPALQIAQDLINWMKKNGNIKINIGNFQTEKEPIPISVNVKDAINNFNALASQKQNNFQPSNFRPSNFYEHDSRSMTTVSSFESFQKTNRCNQALLNERYVSILNHCFDDIERFVFQLQQTVAAFRELEFRAQFRKGKKWNYDGDEFLAMKICGPNEEEFYEILNKFKLAFNLLAKLKGCIRDPNAPELVHFLFTPLAIIVEAAKSNNFLPDHSSLLEIPSLSPEAICLLSNCCTSKEYDLWQSLGISWTQPIQQQMLTSSKMQPSLFQPVFTDGWAPAISDPDLMGFISCKSEISESKEDRKSQSYFQPFSVRNHIDYNLSSFSHLNEASKIPQEEQEACKYLSEAEQIEWLKELESRDAKIVQIFYPRTTNNQKELTVARGEFLEILDSSKNWWKARNSKGQIAYVPNTIIDINWRARILSKTEDCDQGKEFDGHFEKVKSV